MRDRSLIYIGLFLFLGLATFPFYYNSAAGRTPKSPELILPAHETQCVAPTNYMKSSHMQLLTQWRENRVRNDIRIYRAFNGKSYNVALTGTCLSPQCHGNTSEFCNRCHTYVGVQGPYCMDCHIDPGKIQRSGL
jgi:hypothetical protein